MLFLIIIITNAPDRAKGSCCLLWLLPRGSLSLFILVFASISFPQALLFSVRHTWLPCVQRPPCPGHLLLLLSLRFPSSPVRCFSCAAWSPRWNGILYRARRGICFSVCPQSLKELGTHSRCSINTCWLDNTTFWGVKDKLPLCLWRIFK